MFFAFWLAGLIPTPNLLVEVDEGGRILSVLSMALIVADLRAWGLPLLDFPTECSNSPSRLSRRVTPGMFLYDALHPRTSEGSACSGRRVRRASFFADDDGESACHPASSSNARRIVVVLAEHPRALPGAVVLHHLVLEELHLSCQMASVYFYDRLRDPLVGLAILSSRLASRGLPPQRGNQ